MARVLVVERREMSRAAALLELEGFTVITAVHRQETAATVSTFQPDLVLVEAVSPSDAVLELCSSVRAASSAALALLCGPHSERDAVAAFGVGVDQLVLDSVGHHELIARVRALLRRAPLAAKADHDVITVGPIVLDLARRELFVSGAPVRIPRREFDIAELLMRDAGRVVPRQLIVRALWGVVRDTKSLDVQVGRLRARLVAVEGRRRIVTIRGVGYRFLLDDDPEFASPEVEATEIGLPTDDAIDIHLARHETRSAENADALPELLEGSASA